MKNKEPRVSQDSLSREEKLKRIYEVVSNKTLTRWCYILKDGLGYFITEADEVKLLCRQEWLPHNNSSMVFVFKDDVRCYTILWHPVMLWDVLEYNTHSWEKAIESNEILFAWWDLHYSEELKYCKNTCVDYVYSLLEATTDHTSY